MQENTLSNNLSRIQEATDVIREITGTQGEVIEDVAQAVSDLNDDNIAKDAEIADLEQQIEELTPSGSIYIDYNGLTNVAGYEYADINVPEPSGDMEITENGYYDVRDYENVDVNVEGGETPTGSIEINYDGTYDVTDYAEAIVNVGGTPTNIYKVASVEDMEALTPEEGSICLVYNYEKSSIDLTEPFNQMCLESHVVVKKKELPTDWWNADIRMEEPQGEISMPRLSDWGCNLEINEWDRNFNLEFEDNDGNNLHARWNIITDWWEELDDEDPVELELEIEEFPDFFDSPSNMVFEYNIYIDTNDEIPSILSKLITGGTSLSFGGIYMYHNDSWNYLDIGINTQPNEILLNSQAYTSNGIIEGTIGSPIESAEDIVTGAFLTIPNTLANYQLDGSIPESNCQYCAGLKLLDLSHYRSNSMVYMFYYLHNIREIDVEGWKLPRINNMERLAFGLEHLEKFNASYWKTDYVSKFGGAFQDCYSLTECILKGWWSGIDSINADRMFAGCSSLQLLDMRDFDFTKIQDHSNMFDDVPNNCVIVVKNNAQKTWFQTHYSRLINVQTIEEYEPVIVYTFNAEVLFTDSSNTDGIEKTIIISDDRREEEIYKWTTTNTNSSFSISYPKLENDHTYFIYVLYNHYRYSATSFRFLMNTTQYNSHLVIPFDPIPVPLSDFDTLDYIENTSTAWIDTGVFLDTLNAYTTEVKCCPTNCAGGGGGSGSERGWVMCSYGDATRRVGVGEQWGSYHWNKDGYTVDPDICANGQIVTAYGQANNRVDSNYLSPISLFSLTEKGKGMTPNQNFLGKIYYAKIWKSGTLIRDFIPVKRKADDVIGMYDQVNNIFYTSPNGIAFIGGNE